MSCAISISPVLSSSWNLTLSLPLYWYAVYTYPRHEKSVAERLESNGVETFLPTFTTESQWKDRRVKIEVPVFPGYVFVRMSSAQRGKVLSAPGVIRVLSLGGVPIPLDDSEIEGIRLCLDRGMKLEPHPFLEVGDRVRVRSGQLAGLEGRISQRKNKRRLIVPLTLINQSMAVEIDAYLLESLEIMDGL